MNEGRRKLMLMKTTELDRVTNKVAKATQNFEYDSLNKEVFIEHFEVKEGSGMILIPITDSEWIFRSSTVNKVEQTENQLIVETRNTVYFFEVLND